MKRTTIMVEEELLYDLQAIARKQGDSMSSVIREALATYVVEKQAMAPDENPLLGLIGLGSSAGDMNLADGADEEMLKQGVHPVHGWSVEYDSDR